MKHAKTHKAFKLFDCIYILFTLVLFIILVLYTDSFKQTKSFKYIIFQKKKRLSQANLFAVPFGRYNLMESMPLSMLKRLEDEVPPVFMILDTFDKDVKTLSPGTHLFCVYGDNWYEKTI